MRIVPGLIAALIMAMGNLAPAAAQKLDSSGREVVVLKPGDFVWYDTPTFSRTAGEPGNGIAITISLPAQLAYVYRDGVLIAVSTISTGKPGKDTPTGEYTVLEKQRFHRSNLYSAAPMPWMQRLTWDGIALHAGHLPGYPASHGCIRLPAEFARKLYGATGRGTQVSVLGTFVDDPLHNPRGTTPMLRVDVAALEGGTYDQVFATREALPPLINTVQLRSASPVWGATREIVQPIPPGAH